MHTNSNEKKVHQNVDKMAAGAHDAVDWAADTSNQAAETLSDASREMKETQEQWLAMARSYVQENPATAVGIALAGGYFISQILRSR